jgi:DNA-binding CsgD family transcriptional regulator
VRTLHQAPSDWPSSSTTLCWPIGSLQCSWVCQAPDAVVVPSTAVSTSADGDVPLTPRELQVLALLAEGASNKVIARRLGISVHTAKFHVASLLDKLDAVGRTDAVAHAARRGVINL